MFFLSIKRALTSAGNAFSSGQFKKAADISRRCFDKLYSEQGLSSEQADMLYGACNTLCRSLLAMSKPEECLKAANEALKQPLIRGRRRGILLCRCGEALKAECRFDDAAKRFKEGIELVSEVKNIEIGRLRMLYSEAAMKAEDIYMTDVFTDQCDYLFELSSRGVEVPFETTMRAAAMGAKATLSMSQNSRSLYYAEAGLNAALGHAIPLELHTPALACCIYVLSQSLSLGNNERALMLTDKVLQLLASLQGKPLDKAELTTLADISVLLAVAYLRAGKKQEAENKLREALAGYPKQPKAPFCGINAAQFYLSLVKEEEQSYPIEFFISPSTIDDVDHCISRVFSYDGHGMLEFSERGLAFLIDCIPETDAEHLSNAAADRGISLFYLRRYADSAATYERAFEFFPDDPNIGNKLLGCAESYLKAGDAQKACECFRRGVEHLEKDAENRGAALRNYAYKAYNADYPPVFCAELFGNAAEAITAEEEYYYRADCYNKRGLCLHNADLSPEDELSAYSNAKAILCSHDDERSRTLLTAVHFNAADVYDRLGRTESADKSLKDCISICEQFETERIAYDRNQLVYALRDSADLMNTREDYDGAIATLTRALNILKSSYPADDMPLGLIRQLTNFRGTCHYRAGHYNEAITDSTTAIDIGERIPLPPAAKSLVYANRSDSYEELEKYESMLADCKASLLLYSEDPQAEPEILAEKQFLVARACKYLIRPEETIDAFTRAISMFSELISKHPDNSEYLGRAAFSHYQLALVKSSRYICDFNASLVHYTRAIELLEGSGKAEFLPQLCAIYSARAEFFDSFSEHRRAMSDYETIKQLRERIALPDEAKMNQPPAQ